MQPENDMLLPHVNVCPMIPVPSLFVGQSHCFSAGGGKKEGRELSHAINTFLAKEGGCSTNAEGFKWPEKEVSLQH